MLIIENTGEKPAVPKMTAEMILQIKAKCISSVRISQRITERICFFGHQRKMDMVSHQSDSKPRLRFAEKGKGNALAIPDQKTSQCRFPR
jgi:hypothetical protein